MRILRLRFRNLNSLAGDWDIDFTHPDYVSSGIFAITGPTGSGKTTVLDAICLSLYGQTPRLGKITQSGNEIMSRQLGECAAEVEFETAKGHFRCHWSQHRARKQADGKLQAPRHEIAEAATGLIIESKLTAVAGKVEEVTGMDFERFTRSMLLAQGGFAAFLQARPDERAPILEQITGTEIYSRISMKVHDRTSEERGKLEALRADLNGMQLLSTEEEARLRSEQAEKGREVTDLSALTHEVQEQKVWRERIETLETEIARNELAWRTFEEKKENAALQLEQLARGRRALVLDGDYVNLEGVRKQQRAEQAEWEGARERLPNVRQACQAAADELEKADGVLQQSQAEQVREAESIRKTRELDTKLDEARPQLQALETETGNLGKQANDYRAAITIRDDRIREAGTLLQTVEVFLTDHRADAGLAEALTGIGQQVKALKALGEQCTGRHQQLERQIEAIETAGKAQQQFEIDWKTAMEAVAIARDQLASIRTERETLLQGRDLPGWRAEAEALATRETRLQTLLDGVLRVGEARQKLESVRVRQENLEQTRQDLYLQEIALTQESELRETVVRQLQDKVVLLNRVRDLEAERERLIDGVPCPLCGATEHPYSVGNMPCPDETQKALERGRIEIKETGDRLSAVKAAQTGVAKDLEQAERDVNDYRGILDRDEPLCAGFLVELELSNEGTSRPDVFRVELELCRETLAGGRAIIQQAEGKDAEERAANASYDKLKDKLAERETARQAATIGYENAVNERNRLERESSVLKDNSDRALGEVVHAVDPFGCPGISLQNADEILAALTVRRNRYGERLQEKEKFEKELSGLGNGAATLRALLAEVERNLSEKVGLLRERHSHREELAALRQELFGDRNPDSEEMRLADALKQADEARNAAWQEQNRLQTEGEGLAEQVRKLAASIGIRAGVLAELEPSLQRRVSEAGFAEEADFLEARLPQARFDELAHLAEALLREEADIQARLKDRSATLQMERDKKLTVKTSDQIREEHAAVSLQLSELQMVLGALGQKLQQHIQLQALQQVRLRAIDLHKIECARWERLHELIGSADGKKFRNFAQGLTFELMVAHANRQLQKMSDRYILVRDINEPLELNVIDNYQAGEIRSTKNLSGGESFIVSLALALGLSNMASRNVRVDSLFLDEGFGTLDEDALETALETLSGLQQDGKLIGIISHVPALKERIGTQIQVEVGNGGRSSLSGPGCRRVV